MRFQAGNVHESASLFNLKEKNLIRKMVGFEPTTQMVQYTTLRDGSLFMGMTESGKNRTGFENFSCRGDGLCVFFLNKETGL